MIPRRVRVSAGLCFAKRKRFLVKALRILWLVLCCSESESSRRNSLAELQQGWREITAVEHFIDAGAGCALGSRDLCSWPLLLPASDLRGGGHRSEAAFMPSQAQEAAGSGLSVNPAAARSPHITGSHHPSPSLVPGIGSWVLVWGARRHLPPGVGGRVLTVGARRHLLSTLVEVGCVPGLDFLAFSKTQGCTIVLDISSNLGPWEISVSSLAAIILLRPW